MARFNLRQKPRVSYYEPEEPSLDEYVFCSECGDYVYEYCSIHGPLLFIPDNKIPSKPDVPSFIPRAALTIPNVFLHLDYSIIPGAGLGVFATLTLPRGVRFGPYKGKKTLEIKSSYCWQVRDVNNKRSHVVDASDPNNSNWMRYVNCSRHWSEQNLVAYQYRGQIYYRTIKIIPRFTELMVYYGSEFACELGIDLKKYNTPSTYAQKLGTQTSGKKSVKTKNTLQDKINENGDSKTSCIKKDFKRRTKRIINTNNTTDAVITNSTKQKALMSIDSIEIIEPSHEKNINFSVVVEPSKSKANRGLIVAEKTNYHNVTENNSNNILTIQNSNNKVLEYKNSYKEISNTNQDTEINDNKDINNNCNRKWITKYNCDICPYVANRESTLNNHLLLHANVKAIPFFKCKYCLHVSITKKNIWVHELSHTGKYTCDVCGRKFSGRTNLITHKRTHTGEKPYTCDTCGRKFSQRIHLIKHKRTHTGEKPYTCDICGRKFSRRTNLITHKRTHTGEKPYTCDICGRKFSRRTNLITHKRTHTGEKPYTCDICGRKFSLSSNLIKHKRTHASKKPYTCDMWTQGL